MKTKLFFSIIACFIFSFIANAQYTQIPDSNFELALGAIDDIPNDNQVLTTNINTLTFLNVVGKNISDLTGIEDFISLTRLECYENNLTNLDVSNNTALTVLWTAHNNLTSLDVTYNFALENLHCQNNQITSLDVTENTELIELRCDGNELTSLDVSNNIELITLWCYGNQLTSLDVTENIKLEDLRCGFNPLIGTLDVSLNTSLRIFKAPSTDLSCLNVKNGNNHNISNHYFRIQDNPNLFCVQVDDADYSSSIWTAYVDGQIEFSEDTCSGCDDDCVDVDQDGVCADVDCDDNDPNVTTTVTPECTIIGTDEVKLENDNTVIGDVCEDPAADLIPTFYFNTVSTDDSPDVKVEDGETLVLNGQVFGKIEVKEGGTLIFTESNIFINELKTEKHTTIKFGDCANVFINKKLEINEYSNFNPEMNNVTLYVDDNVEVKKGSFVSAHIYANTHEIKAEGDENYPIYMKGMFVAKKVEGKKYVTWEGSAYCNPCPIEIPEPTVSCECKGGLTQITVEYEGVEFLSSNSGIVTDTGNNTYTINTTGDKLEKDLEIYVGGSTAEIHTSCSQDIIGVTFSGGVTVIGYVDTEGNMTTVDGCSQAPVPDCECEGGLTQITVKYEGVESLSSNSGVVTNNGGGTYTIDTTGDKLEKDLEIYVGDSKAEIHTSCSREILGVMYSGGITVVGYIDTEGSVTSIETCPVAPEECECKGGLIEVTFSYDGGATPSSNSGSVTPNNDGTYTVYNNGLKLEKNLEITTNSGVAEIHTSCSQDILGVIFSGGVTVVKHVDTEGNVCSIIDITAGRQGNTSAKGSDVGSKDEFNKVDFNVKSWPNPTRDNFNIRINSNISNELVKVQVLNIMGQIVISDSFNSNQDYKFGNKLESGLYFVKVSQGENLKVLRLMKY